MNSFIYCPNLMLYFANYLHLSCGKSTEVEGGCEGWWKDHEGVVRMVRQGYGKKKEN